MSQKIVIIGGGLSGQLAAYLLSRQGVHVTLCEAEKEVGGRCRVDHIHGLLIDHHLALNLMTPSDAKRLGLAVSFVEISDPPLYYHQKEWYPVTEGTPPLTEGQELYRKRPTTFIKGGVESLFGHLKTQNREIHLSQPIIDVEVNDLRVRRVKSIKKTWDVDHSILATPFSVLRSLVDESYFHKTFLKQFKNQPYHAAVKLDFIFKKPISDLKSILFSLEANGIGYFPSNLDPSRGAQGKQTAEWLFFLSEAELGDKEEIAKRIRAGKRFLKKAFLNGMEQLLWERVSILPHLYPQEVQTLPPEWTSLKNLYWVGYEPDWVSRVEKCVEKMTNV